MATRLPRLRSHLRKDSVNGKLTATVRDADGNILGLFQES
jgi:hypothetical protein